jgi:hypothetical protein
VLTHHTSTTFFPIGSTWINCKTPNMSPHSNKRGPRTMLALAIIASHPDPAGNTLTPYINSNLAQYSRTWMGMLLIQGQVNLPSRSDLDLIPLCATGTILSVPKTLIDWRSKNSCHQSQDLQTTTDDKHNTINQPTPYSQQPQQQKVKMENIKRGKCTPTMRVS